MRVEFDIQLVGKVCGERIHVSALGMWLGEPNPARDEDRFYFAAATNTTATFFDSPFTIERCPQGRRALLMRRRSASSHEAPLGESLWRVSDRERWTVNSIATGIFCLVKG